ncbi:hypothetical protein LRS13_18100 [Svornostia abyssi]|uniref:Uncharacterized protein n=1 Tax=Svornostia abyssi TaxID=2898438 RepID=A0ABY5PD99_9ACTN|nr:hypothetical protein LRS13_18100 [Parviterribacteraceae bacterium J379]
MARTVDQPTAAPGRDLLDLVDAALTARGVLTPADACALLAPLPSLLDGARLEGGEIKVPARTRRDVRAVLAAFDLAPAPRPSSGGLVPFRAPELAAGAPATSRSDVYAIAGLLRTAVTGQDPPPWTLKTMPASAPQLTGTFGDVLWDALADDPAKRPPSPSALLAAATAAVAGPTTADLETEPTSAPEARRLRVIAASAGAAFVLGLIVAVSGNSADVEPAPRPVIIPPPIAAPDAPVTQARAAYAAELGRALRRLNVRRVARRERLADARTSRGQSRAATALAEASGIAARSVGRADAPADVRAADRELVATLRLVESAYRTMARGARDGDRAQFVRGRDAVRRREALLQRRIQRLERLGFDVR